MDSTAEQGLAEDLEEDPISLAWCPMSSSAPSLPPLLAPFVPRQTWLLGDFVLILRFGGKYATDEHDVSKILFRYVGNTAFLAEGPIELRKAQVDMMRRYATGFEDEQFLLELDFKVRPLASPNLHVGNRDVCPSLVHVNQPWIPRWPSSAIRTFPLLPLSS